METNYHYVLWYEADRTILVKHQEYPSTSLANISSPKWVYISSLGGNSYDYHVQIMSWLAKNPSTKVAFQPGTFQMNLGIEKLKDLYARTDIFFCNKEEAQRILNSTEHDIKETDVSHACIGSKDCCHNRRTKRRICGRRNRKRLFHMPPYPDPKARRMNVLAQATHSLQL